MRGAALQCGHVCPVELFVTADAPDTQPSTRTGYGWLWRSLRAIARWVRWRVKHQAVRGMVMVLLAAMLWGTTGTAQSLLPPGLPAHWVGALRLLVAGVFFAIYIPFERGAGGLLQQYRQLPWRYLVLAAGCVATYNLSFFAGVKAGSVAVGTAIAIGSGPIFAGLMQAVFLRQPPGRVWWLGTLLAVAGGSLMVAGGVLSAQTSVQGVVLCLVAGLAYAAYTLLSKKMVSDANASMVAQCTFSLAALLAATLAFGVSGLPHTTPGGWLVVLYLGAIATGLAYLLFTHALRHIASSTAVSIVLVEPLTAFCLAIVVVGERPGVAGFLGLGLVMAGLALVVRDALRHAAAPIKTEGG